MQTQNKEMDRAPEQQCSSSAAAAMPPLFPQSASVHGPSQTVIRESAQTGLGVAGC